MKSKPIKAPPLLTIVETAELFAVSKRTIHNWIKTELLAAKKIGGVVRICRSEVEKLIGGAE